MKKVNLKPLIKSKFFQRSVVVLLLITTVSFYILKEKEKKLRIYIQRQFTETIEKKKAIEGKLIDTIKSKEMTEEELASEKNRVLELEKETQEKERQIGLTLERVEREITARRQAENRLIMVMKEKNILQEKLGRFVKKPKPIELEKIVIKPASVLVGNILRVSKEYGFVLANLGRVNNISLGDILSVYRNDEFIGMVQVEKLEEEACAAVILSDWQTTEFKENDEVREI